MTPAPSPRRIPGATYRLQFCPQFTLRDATAQVAYLHALGITDCYASPLFQPRPGSTHGYDVCNPNHLNPELGTEADLDSFCHALHSLGMGLLLDIVPNHMGIGHPANLWWTSLLQHGRHSPFAHYFDVDWTPPNPGLANKILLPILGQPYAQTLEGAQLQLVLQEGHFLLSYFEKRLPLSPSTWRFLFDETFSRLPPGSPPETADREHLLRTLQSWSDTRQAQHHQEIQKQLRAWQQNSVPFARCLSEVLTDLNGTPGQRESFDTLDTLLAQQHYRLAFWRVGPFELNYRRFFDITDLAGLCVQHPDVFLHSHRLLSQWLAEGKVTGLRIDHPDGLWDPNAYFRRLQALQQLCRPQHTSLAPPTKQALEDSAQALDSSQADARLFVVAEKILACDEQLPADWPIDGTTGYDFLNQLNGLFVESAQAKTFDRIYRTFTGRNADFHEEMLRGKRAVLEHSLISEANALGRQLQALAARNRQSCDFTRPQLQQALCELIAALPVYRTYVAQSSGQPSAQDRTCVTQAAKEAARENPQWPAALFEFFRRLLLLENTADFRDTPKAELVAFVMKVQQLTGPVMAKGTEDTAFYVYNRLVSLNEVGGHPGQFGIPAEEFHRLNLERHRSWPNAMLATATHDTKRGEDVRARLNVLSEIPHAWEQALHRWARLNAAAKTTVRGEPAPSRNDEYLLYQTLLGAWPLGLDPLSDPARRDRDIAPYPVELPEQTLETFQNRIAAYVVKAAKEAKIHTSWIDPDPDYEEALVRFVNQLLDQKASHTFLQDFLPFQRRIAWLAHFNSLAQVLLKLTAPGVPDCYQGTELWDLSLVDPDNRRPVDFAVRQSWLRRLQEEWARAEHPAFLRTLLDHWQTGAPKLFLVWRTLQFRRAHPQLLADGDYVPVTVRGEHSKHLCAFQRVHGSGKILVVVPRLIAGLLGAQRHSPQGEGVWGGTWLDLPKEDQGSAWRNHLTMETLETTGPNARGGLAAGSVLAHYPVALLERIGA